jgi:nucleoid DNA-binding protein
MNELVRMVCERTGLGEDQARKAVDVVVEHLRKALPEPIAAQLDTFLGEGETASQQGAGVISRFFGKS